MGHIYSQNFEVLVTFENKIFEISIAFNHCYTLALLHGQSFSEMLMEFKMFMYLEKSDFQLYNMYSTLSP